MDACAMTAQDIHQSACLLAGTGHDNPLTEHGFLLEPCQFVVQGADSSDNDYGRGLEAAILGLPGHVCQRGNKALLIAPGPPANQGHRGVGRTPVVHEVAGYHGQVANAHVKHEGGIGLAVDGPVVA